LALMSIEIGVSLQGSYVCFDPAEASAALTQIFASTPEDILVTPNVGNQTYFIVNITFVVTNATVFANADGILRNSTSFQLANPKCGSVLGVVQSASIYGAALELNRSVHDATVSFFFVFMVAIFVSLMTVTH